MNHCTKKNERGFVLVMMLLLLVGTGMYLQGSLAANSGLSSLYVRAPRILEELQQAKIALVSSALFYADNYDVAGAGPGHFPCPDTDPPDDGNPNNDGPNPPCGSGDLAVGRLPRVTRARAAHKNTEKTIEYYRLKSMMDRQPWYQVSTGYINNPINRVVNSSTGMALGALSDSLSVTSKPLTRSMSESTVGSEIGSLSVASPFPMAVSPLIPISGPAHWFESVLGSSAGNVGVERSSRGHLIALITDPGPELGPLQHRRDIQSVQHYLEGFRSQDGDFGRMSRGHQVSKALPRAYDSYSNDLTVTVWAEDVRALLIRRVLGYVRDWLLEYSETHCSVDLNTDSQLVLSELGNSASASGCFPPAAVWGSLACKPGLLAGGLPLLNGSCARSLSEFGQLDGVDLRRHWFVRNEWQTQIYYLLDEFCLAAARGECEVLIEAASDFEPKELSDLRRLNEYSGNDIGESWFTGGVVRVARKTLSRTNESGNSAKGKKVALTNSEAAEW